MVILDSTYSAFCFRFRSSGFASSSTISSSFRSVCFTVYLSLQFCILYYWVVISKANIYFQQRKTNYIMRLLWKCWTCKKKNNSWECWEAAKIATTPATTTTEASETTKTTSIEISTSTIWMATPLPPAQPKLVAQPERPPKFLGVDFVRWQRKMLFYLTTLGCVSYLKEDGPPTPSENETDVNVRTCYDRWCSNDFLCRNYVLNGIDDGLDSVFENPKTSKKLWEALDKKYGWE